MSIILTPHDKDRFLIVSSRRYMNEISGVELTHDERTKLRSVEIELAEIHHSIELRRKLSEIGGRTV